ncbi:hypothetical protein PGTUg99_032215 [Puccinia graminis f. sp. tritici]|uniref:Uncharacterized protein n=1 Tax=Puccinia graminis f. sp. tritici TaxID=56615 RepID=A0A5B0PNK4_PUCGR|nr:hypothetical protein PGTUg99_032215 [Puccinia graminis f. sp. tritici]
MHISLLLKILMNYTISNSGDFGCNLHRHTKPSKWATASKGKSSVDIVSLSKGGQAHHIRLKLDTKAAFRENEVPILDIVTVYLEGKVSCPFKRRN